MPLWINHFEIQVSLLREKPVSGIKSMSSASMSSDEVFPRFSLTNFSIHSTSSLIAVGNLLLYLATASLALITALTCLMRELPLLGFLRDCGLPLLTALVLLTPAAGFPSVCCSFIFADCLCPFTRPRAENWGMLGGQAGWLLAVFSFPSQLTSEIKPMVWLWKGWVSTPNRGPVPALSLYVPTPSSMVTQGALSLPHASWSKWERLRRIERFAMPAWTCGAPSTAKHNLKIPKETQPVANKYRPYLRNLMTNRLAPHIRIRLHGFIISLPTQICSSYQNQTAWIYHFLPHSNPPFLRVVD